MSRPVESYELVRGDGRLREAWMWVGVNGLRGRIEGCSARDGGAPSMYAGVVALYDFLLG